MSATYQAFKKRAEEGLFPQYWHKPPTMRERFAEAAAWIIAIACAYAVLSGAAVIVLLPWWVLIWVLS